MNSLNKHEEKLASKLIKGGIAMAKVSLGRALKSSMTIKQFEYGKGNGFRFCSKTTGKVFVVRTELMGDIDGSCHLILSEDELSRIYKACLPAKVMEDSSPTGDLMRDGFLAEIDNMMASAVITEMADKLELDLFGKVPKTKSMDASEVDQYIISQAASSDLVTHYRAVFHGEELDILPDFIMVFDESFINVIKKIT